MIVLPEDLEVLKHLFSIGAIVFTHLFQKSVHEVPELDYTFEPCVLYLLNIHALRKGQLEQLNNELRHIKLAQDFLQQSVEFSSIQSKRIVCYI